MADIALTEQFEIAGQWYLPGNDAMRIPGTLSHSRAQTDLKLNGSFESLPSRVSVADRPKTYPRIFGVTLDGRAMTIFDALDAGSSMSFGSGGFVHSQRLVSARLVIGAHLPAGFESSRMAFRFPGLQTWLARDVIQQKWNTDATGKTSFDFHLADAEHEEIFVGSAATSIRWGYGRKVSADRFSHISVEVSGWISLQPHDPKNLDWYLEMHRALAAMLTFICGQPMSADCIKSSLDKQSELDVLVALQVPKYKVAAHPSDFFLSRTSMGIPLNQALEMWFAQYEKLEAPASLAVSVLSSENLWTHVEFLSLIQALEGVHRSLFAGQYVDPTSYESIRKSLTSAIPQAVSPDHKDALKSRIRYGYQFSLRKRLEELAQLLDPNVRVFVFGGSEGKVPGTWIETRNYFTHWDEGLKADVLDHQSIYYANVRLRGFLHAVFLVQMGIPQASIAQAFTGTSDLAQSIAQVNAILRLATDPNDQSGTLMTIQRSSAIETKDRPREVSRSIDEEERVLRALESAEWDFRTISGLSKETGLSPQSVETILKARSDVVRESKLPSESGQRLFTLKVRGGPLRDLWTSLRMISEQKF